MYSLISVLLSNLIITKYKYFNKLKFLELILSDLHYIFNIYNINNVTLKIILYSFRKSLTQEISLNYVFFFLKKKILISNIILINSNNANL